MRYLLADDDGTLGAALAPGDPVRPKTMAAANRAVLADLHPGNTCLVQDPAVDLL